jgi:hypothetical protein
MRDRRDEEQIRTVEEYMRNSPPRNTQSEAVPDVTGKQRKEIDILLKWVRGLTEHLQNVEGYFNTPIMRRRLTDEENSVIRDASDFLKTITNTDRK